MSGDSWTYVKEQVRQAVDIVDLVGSYVQLQRQAGRFVGLCPWHDDTRPSLQVNPDRQSFKCWVCDIGGDVFSFVMQAEGVDFREALGLLADRAGIALPSSRAGAAGPSKVEKDDRQALYQVMAWAEQQFHQCLLEAAEAKTAREYLRQRGISDETIRLFRIGFSPNRWDWLLSRVRSAPFDAAILERVGLAVPRPDGHGHYDRFRGRVLFPIRDVRNHPIAIGGRILPQHAEETRAKYVNSPETPLFSKSKHLYGLNIARQRLGKERNIVVVEGYTDCVIAHQYGFSNVVAVLGTALGERQIRLLRGFADSITLTLDGDEAGRRRAGEILELFVAMQVNLRILVLPEDRDPCDVLLTQGSEAFGRMLAGAVDALEHKIRMATKGLDPSADTHGAHAALEDVLGTLARAPRLASISSSSARLREEQVLTRLSHWSGVPEEPLRGRLAELRRRGRKPRLDSGRNAPATARPPSTIDPWDRELLELILRRPDWLPKIGDAILPESLRSEECRLIYSTCLRLAAAGGTPDFDTLMLELEDAHLRHLLVQLEERCRAKADSDAELQLEQTLGSYRRRKEDAQHRRRIAALQDEPSEAGQVQTLDQLLTALRPRHRTSNPTDG